MKRRKAERTREKIINTFYQLNLDLTRPLSTVPEICDALDISVSTFYCHFSGINDLIEQESEKLKDFWNDFTEEYKRNATYATPATIFPRELVAAIVRGYLNRRTEHLVLMRPDFNLPFREYLKNLVISNSAIHTKFISKTAAEYVKTYLAEGGTTTIFHYLEKGDMSESDFVDLLYSMSIAIIREAEKWH